MPPTKVEKKVEAVRGGAATRFKVSSAACICLSSSQQQQLFDICYCYQVKMMGIEVSKGLPFVFGSWEDDGEEKKVGSS